MDPRREEENRFRINELEDRIAPGAALAGLTNALESAAQGVAAVDAAQGAGAADAIVDNIVSSNPESGDC
jgi:hypothetical protein